MNELIKNIFTISPDIRYVAIYQDGKLESSVRGNIEEAGSSESDKYEELIVNPAILTLIKQRGDIDCGGAEYVLIRYGNFYQFVTFLPKGHISVCIEPNSDPLKLKNQILEIINKYKIS